MPLAAGLRGSRAAGRGWWLCMASLQGLTVRGLSLVLASEDVFDKSSFDIKEDSLPSQSRLSILFWSVKQA